MTTYNATTSSREAAVHIVLRFDDGNTKVLLLWQCELTTAELQEYALNRGMRAAEAQASEEVDISIIDRRTPTATE